MSEMNVNGASQPIESQKKKGIQSYAKSGNTNFNAKAVAANETKEQLYNYIGSQSEEFKTANENIEKGINDRNDKILQRQQEIKQTLKSTSESLSKALDSISEEKNEQTKKMEALQEELRTLQTTIDTNNAAVKAIMKNRNSTGENCGLSDADQTRLNALKRAQNEAQARKTYLLGRIYDENGNKTEDLVKPGTSTDGDHKTREKYASIIAAYNKGVDQHLGTDNLATMQTKLNSINKRQKDKEDEALKLLSKEEQADIQQKRDEIKTLTIDKQALLKKKADTEKAVIEQNGKAVLGLMSQSAVMKHEEAQENFRLARDAKDSSVMTSFTSHLRTVNTEEDVTKSLEANAGAINAAAENGKVIADADKITETVKDYGDRNDKARNRAYEAMKLGAFFILPPGIGAITAGALNMVQAHDNTVASQMKNGQEANYWDWSNWGNIGSDLVWSASYAALPAVGKGAESLAKSAGLFGKMFYHAGIGGASMAGFDAASQGVRIAGGKQDKFDWEQAGWSGAIGGALSAGMRLFQGVVSGEAMNEFKNSKFVINRNANRMKSFVDEMKSKNITIDENALSSTKKLPNGKTGYEVKCTEGTTTKTRYFDENFKEINASKVEPVNIKTAEQIETEKYQVVQRLQRKGEKVAPKDITTEQAANGEIWYKVNDGNGNIKYYDKAGNELGSKATKTTAEQSALDQQQQKIDTLAEAKEQSIQKLQNTAQEVTDLKKSIRALEKETRQAQKAVNKTQKALQKANDAENKLNNEITQTKQDLQSTQNNITKAQGEVDQAKNDVRAFETKVETTENQYKNAKTQKSFDEYREAQKDLLKSKNDLQAKEDILKQAKEKNTQAQDKLSKLQEQVKDAKETTSKAQTAHNNALKEQKKLQNPNEAHQKEIGKLQKELSIKNKTLETQRNDHEAINNQRTTEDNNLKAITDSYDKRVNAIKNQDIKDPQADIGFWQRTNDSAGKAWEWTEGQYDAASKWMTPKWKIYNDSFKNPIGNIEKKWKVGLKDKIKGDIAASGTQGIMNWFSNPQEQTKSKDEILQQSDVGGSTEQYIKLINDALNEDY